MIIESILLVFYPRTVYPLSLMEVHDYNVCRVVQVVEVGHLVMNSRCLYATDQPVVIARILIFFFYIFCSWSTKNYKQIYLEKAPGIKLDENFIACMLK